MRRRKLLTGAIVLSGVAHVMILFLFALIQWGMIEKEPILIETVFSDEREQEEFSQELDLNTEVSENLNPIAGGAVTGAVGASTGGPPISQARIEMSQSLKDPELVASITEFAMPGESLLADDLGDAAVMGETGAVVEGYGAAMSRLTREILRMMRESKVMVVWLFDESESMKDDQQEIADQFHKIYEELGIAAKSDKELSKRPKGDRLQDEVLLTAITSYGEKLNFLLDPPSGDVEKIREAIGKIQIDKSGKENMCTAIREAISKYRTMAGRQDRRLVLVLVSDESGDDGQFVEEALQEAKRANSPIYILGREAVFGYPYASQRWVDPKFNIPFWIRMNRGPETALPEALQWDGFGARDDAYQSGFGPYEQVRLVKETGGVYFMLPGDEENLSGAGAHNRRKFDFLAMKEYQPKLTSRREYEAERAKHPFRMTVWNVIVKMNPHIDKQLSVRRHHYRPQEFAQEARTNFDKAVRALGLADQAVAVIEKARPGRDHEESWRWRAAYDLLYAQLLTYRVRLFQYLLALDKHVKNPPPFKDPKNNEWNVTYVKEMLPPDPEQVKATKIDIDVLEEQRKKAIELYQFVLKEHPGTAWARRAEQELGYGFGIRFVEGYRDPRVYDPEFVKSLNVPKL